MLGGFGEQGQRQSKDCAFDAGKICDTPIRVSYFVGIMFGYQLMNILRGAHGTAGDVLLWQILNACGNQAILMMTVLCHEFGHGNMARYLGGHIDHILLWVFGGICFSSRPQGITDNAKLLKNDLLIVVAGPATHFAQAPAWGLFLGAMFVAITSLGGQTGYDSAWHAFTSALHPMSGGVSYGWVWQSAGKWTALLWTLFGQAISLNVALFIFNVFFPMYPADGSKLLVTGLMFFCGTPPRHAALVLIIASTTCAGLMLLYAAHGILFGGNYMAGLMGWMAFMSLQESSRIWTMRNNRVLHMHPLFQIARSWSRREYRPGFGYVNTINVSDLDDRPLEGVGWRWCPTIPSPRNWSCAGCLACLFPCLVNRNADLRPPLVSNSDFPAAAEVHSQGQRGPPPISGAPPLLRTQGEARELRDHRGAWLQNLETRQADRQRTVRDYMDARYAGGGQPPVQAATGASAERGSGQV